MTVIFAAFFLLVGAAWAGIWIVSMDSLRFLSRLAAIMALTFFALATMAAFQAAGAQDHHPLHKDFYSTWQRNDGKGSCCNARMIGPHGYETGDCEPTEAKLIGGRWYARLPNAGAFIEVPEATILKKQNPTQDGTDAHLCWTQASGVICFVPPFGGG